MSDEDSFVRPTPAVWSVRRRWLSVIALSLIPVVLTAVGSAAGQILVADDSVAALLIAAGAAVSAGIGLIMMHRSRQPYRSFGFRRPQNARVVWWFVPPALTIAVIAFTGGMSSDATWVAYLVMAGVVGINEEVWFRGIVLALLRPAGIRVAVIGTSIIFGVFHLANLAGGASPIATLLQVAFAVLFGLVAVELVIVSGSLWPGVLWHFAWDFVSSLGGNAATPLALAGIGFSCVVMVIYAVRLWRNALSVTE